jgi:hypothetical protein
MIHHSTIGESDQTHASYVDTRFSCHSQIASKGTGAVSVRNVDMTMYSFSTASSSLCWRMVSAGVTEYIEKSEYRQVAQLLRYANHGCMISILCVAKIVVTSSLVS